MKRIILVVLLLIISLVMGCTGTRPGTTINNTSATPGTTINNTSVTPEYPPVADLAKNDLARRLNTTTEQIRLVKQEKRDWPDTSLGYPEEGKMYAQVITPGYVIILEAGGKLYEYHSDYKRVVGPKDL